MKACAAIAAAAAMLWLAGFACFIVYTASLTPSDDKTKTDAIIVLTGGPNRIGTGISLLENGLGGKLFISGVDSRVSREKLLALANSADKPCCVALGHEAQNTAGNAAEARSWAAKEGVRSLRLVTASYHMPRAQLEFRHALPEAVIIPCPVDGREKNLPLLIFGEYNKTLLTVLRFYLWDRHE